METKFILLKDLPGIPAGTISEGPTNLGGAIFKANGNHAFFTLEELKNADTFKEHTEALPVFNIKDLDKAMRYQHLKPHENPRELLIDFICRFYPRHKDQFKALD